jgi:acetyl-CoA C-acetyltransferase
MKEVWIVSACRTAIGAFGGTLKDLNGPLLGSAVMKAAVERAGIDPVLIDDIRFGCCMEHHDNLNVSRVSALLAGIPDTVPAVTINRVCTSGMEALISGSAMIQAGLADIILTGGVEHMSGVPFSVPSARWGSRLQDQSFADGMMRALECGSRIIPFSEDSPVDTTKAPASTFLGTSYLMGQTAEAVAQHLDISREEMDEVALRSHNNAERANQDGSFEAEIVPVLVPRRKKEPLTFTKDEHFRPDLTLEQLQKLPPAFVSHGGKVTAGNSSGLNDGASAILIMSAEKAKDLNLAPLARIKASARGACHPTIMGLSPVPAVKKMQENSGLKVDDFDLIEVHEAFAAQYLGCEKELGLNREITNVNGSGIGLGHPVGSTGCRIMVTLIHAMKKRGDTLGLATICGGGGVAMACAIEMI